MADVPLVDTHVHVIGPEDEFPLRPEAALTAATGEWYRTHPCSIEEFLVLMDEAGVERAVLVQAQSAYGFDNSYVIEAVKRSKGRCVGVGSVDPTGDDPAAAVRELIDAGLSGIRVFAVRGEPIDEPAIWNTCAELDVPIVMTILSDRFEELGQVLEANPTVQVALDHCGFADFSNGVPDDLAALAKHRNLSLKVSTITLDALEAAGDAAEGVAALASAFGDDRLMWGSDYSQTHGRPYSELVARGANCHSGML